MTLGNIDPLLAAALKACLIPARVLMCFARHVAELNLKCCFVRVYVHREVGFQEVLVLFPVDRRLKVDARARGVEVNFLADDRTADLALNLESCAHGAAFRPFHALHVGDVPEFLRIVAVDVPVVVVHRLVLVHAHQVRIFAGLHGLAVVFAVIKARDEPAFIKFNRVERRRDRAAVNVQRVFKAACFDRRKALVALRRQVGQERHSTVFGLLHGISIFAVGKCICGAIFKYNDIAARFTRRIEHRDAFSLRRKHLHAVGRKRRDRLRHRIVFLFRLLVDLVNGGAGQNIMELIQKRIFPQAVERFHGVGELRCCQYAQKLQVHESQLCFAVAALVARHGGVRAAVILEVELALPRGQTVAVFYALVQLVKILPREDLPHLRDAQNAFFHAFARLQHIAGRAAAAVTVAVSDENIVVDVFVLVAFPAAHNGIRVQHAVVGGEEVLHVLADAERGDEMRQHFAAVNAAPLKCIERHFVELVPRKLRRHKVIDAALFHDLRQRAGVAEHIRQPQNAVIHAEFLAEEALAVNELAHKAFAARQVAVGFQPHAALRLPTLFLHALFQARIQLRITLF